MAKQDSKHRALFFHMGPGFHGKIEAHAFGHRYSHVHFVHQPPEMNLSQLVSWTANTIQRHAQESGQTVTLLGHSFGGQLIAMALPQVQDFVSQVRILNSAVDTFDCFANLDEIMNPQTARGRIWWKSKTAQEKLKMIFELAQTPNFYDLYWLKPENQQRYNNIAAQYSFFDPEVFARVTVDLLDTSISESPWKGPVEVYYSLQDNLIRHLDVVLPWQKIFPHCQLIEVQNIGHHGLFESEDLADRFFGA